MKPIVYYLAMSESFGTALIHTVVDKGKERPV